ncbi:MAG: serine hydrolase [Saprospiraceae bacterium]|nr:serine hydrolase [Saprospiraceae bacterium]MCB9325450.1 serine hydrolase [Lewinellaceae bacterium]
MKRLFILIIGICLTTTVDSFNKSPEPRLFPPKPDPKEKMWVDSVFNSLTLDERLGQLFGIRAHSDLGSKHIAEVEAIIKKYKVGGLCFFQGTPEKQVELINRYQALSSPLPLMISIDGEWGLGMRMKASTISFPKQLMLGAIRDNDLIYDFGAEVARQLKRVGVHVNFAPVVDVNNNPANPVIHTRSFGEDRDNVAVKGYMYMKGMQENGVMACAKHFPGHGDTDVDSHLDLPKITHSRSRLDSVELYPFRILAQQGIGSMMIAHLEVPALEKRPNRPTTLSRNTVTNLLRNEIGYDGLLFTDALEMKGVTKYFGPGQVEAEALLAGNDVLLLPEDMGAAIREIKNYIKTGKLDQKQVDDSVKRVLRAKYRLGLTSFAPLDTANVRADLNTPKALALKQKLIENALTLVRNKDGMIPFKELENLNLASISLGSTKKTPFQARMDNYTQMDHFQNKSSIPEDRRDFLIEQLKDKDAVIVGLHEMSSSAGKDYGITKDERNFIDELRRFTKVVVVVFGTPYSLKFFDDADWVLEAYEDELMVQDAAAQALFGGVPLRGRLPVTASKKSAFNTGLETVNLFRMGFSLPEGVGMSSDSLNKIRKLAEAGIKSKAFPGCVVLAAKDGRIIYQEAFGYHTYEKRVKMHTTDLFDLASITKIAASTIAVMKMEDEKLINVNDSLGQYLPRLKGTNKAGLIISDVMAHHAGLKSWIPFYKETLEGRKHPRLSEKFYRTEKSEGFSIEVADNVFLRNDYPDTIFQRIIDSDLNKTRDYKYSDLGFYFISMLTEARTGKTLDKYVQEEFYGPLSLQSTCFNPKAKFPLDRVVPTEKDKYWRNQEVHAYVHDMGAAMMGGVSGHAGLFASAEDLAIIMQMLLWKGEYAGQSFIAEKTVAEFTTRHNLDTRRGIGFDMPQLDPDARSPLSDMASAQTFGHLGFTGTAVWADPETNIIYVFLSNRTFPSMRNYKINKMDIRPKIQTIFYESLN